MFQPLMAANRAGSRAARHADKRTEAAFMFQPVHHSSLRYNSNYLSMELQPIC